MLIHASPVRKQIDDMIGLYRGSPQTFFDELGKFPGMEIVQRFDYDPQDRRTCTWYALTERLGISDAKASFIALNFRASSSIGRIPLSDSMKNAIDEKGFAVSNEPQELDIVCYFNTKLMPMLTHWGIWENGKVVSKFDKGHVFRHDIRLVPSCYGNHALFLRMKPEAIDSLVTASGFSSRTS